jgi:DNA-binding MarR family transcriptional regulator
MLYTVAMESVEETAAALDERLRKLARIVRHNVGYGLSLTSATVLARLHEAGPQRVTDLATLELVAQPTMTALVGRLESRGLVQRTRDGADRRVVTVALTPAGQEKLAELRSDRTAFLAGHMARLGDDELNRLTAALPVLDQILESATT